MQSVARRAFLRGRRPPASGWEAFCQRARQVTEGRFQELSAAEGASCARLAPANVGDIHHARALCAQYGVVFALDGVSRPAYASDVPVLWVEPGPEFGVCERLEPGGPKWFVQPGCLLGQLAEEQLPGFADLPFHLTVAAWLADRALCDWPTGETYRSGITHLSVLLADGASVVLGPFGVQEAQPLGSPALRRLVSGLFELSAGAQAQACRQLEQWPCHYRLDALTPQDGHAVNLAHLLLGHGGDLGWIEWLVLDERLLGRQAQGGDGCSFWRGAHDGAARADAALVDGQVKAQFDPSGVYTSLPMFQTRFGG